MTSRLGCVSGVTMASARGFPAQSRVLCASGQGTGVTGQRLPPPTVSDVGWTGSVLPGGRIRAFSGGVTGWVDSDEACRRAQPLRVASAGHVLLGVAHAPWRGRAASSLHGRVAPSSLGDGATAAPSTAPLRCGGRRQTHARAPRRRLTLVSPCACRCGRRGRLPGGVQAQRPARRRPLAAAAQARRAAPTRARPPRLRGRGRARPAPGRRPLGPLRALGRCADGNRGRAPPQGRAPPGAGPGQAEGGPVLLRPHLRAGAAGPLNGMPARVTVCSVLSGAQEGGRCFPPTPPCVASRPVLAVR